jgi:hypothetical protein
LALGVHLAIGCPHKINSYVNSFITLQLQYAFTIPIPQPIQHLYILTIY